ncbi:hypothetical protein HanIR_Chr06g0272351 [Helianthus annuus]|nr:hypothetical protein HanIR_Chr06g0272351 [Helianthus annuus]
MSSNTTITLKRASKLMDLGVDPLVLMSQMVTLIMDIIAGTKWLMPNMATELQVLLQAG